MLILVKQPIITVDANIFRKCIIWEKVQKFDHLERISFSSNHQLIQQVCHQFLFVVFILLPQHFISIRFSDKSILAFIISCCYYFQIFKHVLLFNFIFCCRTRYLYYFIGAFTCPNHFSHCKLLIIIIFTNSSQIILLTYFLYLSANAVFIKLLIIKFLILQH